MMLWVSSTSASESVLSQLAARREAEVPERPGQALVSTVAASERQKRDALVVAVLLGIGFVAAIPFSRQPLAAVPAFIPAYEAALVITDLITAVLLFGQFAQLRSAALLVLATGYLFDALMIVPHALSFPGLLTSGGWLGAGAQTTAWLYMFWHSGFPLFVLAYAGLKHRAQVGQPAYQTQGAVVLAIASVFALTVALSLIAVRADTLLPAIMAGNSYTPAMKFVVGTTWTLSMASLLALLLNRPCTVLDLWLIVVSIAWLFDIALSAVVNAGRFDLGFYAGRFYGLLAATFVLAIMLLETIKLHHQLAVTADQLNSRARNLDHQIAERTRELVGANRTLSAIMDASPHAIFVVDRDATVTVWSASAERLFGYTAQEALGNLPPYLSAAETAGFQATVASALQAGAATGNLETTRYRKDGMAVDVRAHWSKVINDAGQLLGILYVVENITDARKLEHQLRQSQKMEAIGNLTGGMAHDFNNLLGVIIGNLDLLRDQQAIDPETEELTGEALEAAIRGADLTRRLLAFARRQPLQPQRTDLNELISGIAKLLTRTLGEDIEIELELGADVWPVVVDPAQLEATITNLANNARDAMSGGGQLIIATGNRHLDEDYAAQYAEVQPGDYALIEVSDTGTGMPPEILAHIFEPFYTTKEQGKGTGLGLSMVFGFMKQSGGHINVYSEPEIGTTFRLYLPRTETDALAAVGTGALITRGNGQTVLAVEDNPSLRRIVVRQLSELGYRVVEADLARSAIDILEKEKIDLLLTDVVMPGGINGYELARIALSRWTGLRVILTSGFPDNKIGQDAPSPGVRFLSKPYRRDELAQAITDALS